MRLLLAISILLAAAIGSGPVVAQPGQLQDRYIVVLHSDAGVPANVAADVALGTGGRVGYVYETALRGFSITIPRAALRGLENDPRVASVEEDIPVTAFQTLPTGIDRVFADDNGSISIDGVDDYRVEADVAVLDTGIDVEHPDLNVAGGANCLETSGGPPWAPQYVCDDTQSGDDDNYHGTHVAGTVGALDNGIGVVGVAPGVRLWAVKVLDYEGSGALSAIIKGIDWVVAQGNIEVINMSLGGQGSSSAMNDAVQNAVDNGVTVVVSAGNSNDDAKNYTPANSPAAITISALADFDGAAGGGASPTCRSDQDDTLADFSNWGTVVDLAAPGVCILSTMPIEQGEYETLSGTSMAAPHAAGAAAILASQGYLPADIRAKLEESGNLNWTDDSGDGVQEPLLDVSNSEIYAPLLVSGEDGATETNAAPTAVISYTCKDLACDFDGADSSDSDGSISVYAWDFGDGSTASGQSVSHTYGAEGTYTVTLTVTDDDGATGSEQQDVTVSSSTTEGISLSASGYKVKGVHHVDLTWDGATLTDVDISRDGNLLTTTRNDGGYTDDTRQRGGGSYTYQVCEAGTSTCSSTVTVTF
ncbi:MAG: S8 family serine peptidase [Gammaproteobacteria bacterium]|nr:S8 family serine peptidase [Gammaproteobacteria bacterium]